MAVDMKPLIAQAAVSLVLDKKKKRITVKDIVEECNITRQAFYYHFADIPELLQWMAEQKLEEIRDGLQQHVTPEDKIRYFILLYLKGKNAFRIGIESNYGEDMRRIIVGQVLRLLRELADEGECDMDEFEKDLAVRYHCSAILGLLDGWTDEDTQNLDRIVHVIYEIAAGRTVLRAGD